MILFEDPELRLMSEISGDPQKKKRRQIPWRD
jgi:hypothetical protein